jgi:hypothetical protein
MFFSWEVWSSCSAHGMIDNNAEVERTAALKPERLT